MQAVTGWEGVGPDTVLVSGVCVDTQGGFFGGGAKRAMAVRINQCRALI